MQQSDTVRCEDVHDDLMPEFEKDMILRLKSVCGFVLNIKREARRCCSFVFEF